MHATPSNPMPPRTTRRRLGLVAKLAFSSIGLVLVVLLANSAVNVWLSYVGAREAAAVLAREKVQGAIGRANAFLAAIEDQVGWTTRAEWRSMGRDQQRYDLVRLLRQASAIAEVSYLDPAGRRQMRVSRRDPDLVGDGEDLSGSPQFRNAIADRVWFGPVYLRDGSEPYMTVAFAHAGPTPGVTVAEVNLKFVWDVISDIRIGDTGFAFVVAGDGRLVAHPNLSLVLRGTDLSNWRPVSEAMSQARRERPDAAASEVQDPSISVAPGGVRVFLTHARMDRLGWLVFVQMPVGEAFAPAYAALARTLVLLVVGLGLACVVGTLLARRMVVPIRRLEDGADRIGSGDLSERIDIRTGDEIERLADRFNAMAARIQEAHETLERRVEQRTRELTCSLADLRAAQDRLVQAEKLASLGQLTAGIAHEIKNPLNFVNNFASVSTELLDELGEALGPVALQAEARAQVDDLVPTLRANLEKIGQHGRRADTIVKTMLQHSRMDARERPPVDLNALIDESLQLAYHGMRSERPDLDVALSKRFDLGVGQVHLNPQEVGRAILNVAANGLYAAARRKADGCDPSFEPMVSAATRDLADHVEIRIRDNGTGISEEVKAKMFNPFFTTKPPGEGTGLGLSLCCDIISKRHGGSIVVSTEVGSFTEFTIVLPRRQVDVGPPGGNP